MNPATQFFIYWALAFVTLCVALALLSVFYRLIDFDLHLHGLRKEAVIAVIASAVQAAGFWFSASLFHGNLPRRLVIPGIIVAIIYKLGHLTEWSGYEIGGIMVFQGMILFTGVCLFAGMFKLVVIVLVVFVICLALIANIARSL